MDKPTDAEVDKMYDEVMELIKEKKILTMPEQCANRFIMSHRKHVLAKLKKSLAEVLCKDACEMF